MTTINLSATRARYNLKKKYLLLYWAQFDTFTPLTPRSDLRFSANRTLFFRQLKLIRWKLLS